MLATPLQRLALAAVSITALMIPVAVGSSASAAGAVTWQVRVGIESPDMAVTAMAFLPKNLWVDVGDTVRWKSNSSEPHTVTFLAPGTSLPEFSPFDPSQTGLTL